MENNVSFNQETTLAGKSIVRNIKKAKQKGFYVIMHFIGIDSPDVAKERVKVRVLKGGHGIPEDAIERRYYESIENLKLSIPICDEINIYDNTRNIDEIVYLVNSNVIWKSDYIPKWLNEILK